MSLLVTGFSVIAAIAAATAVSDPKGEIEPRPVFVPRADFATAVERAGRGLTMKYGELRALVRAGAENRFAELVPSLVTGAAITQLRAEAREDGETGGRLAIEATATVMVLRPGLAALALPSPGAALVAADLDGEPAALGVDAEGRAVLFLRGIGEHALRLSYTVPVRPEAGGRAGVRFSLPRAARGTIDLAIAGATGIAARRGLVFVPGAAGAGADRLAGALDGREIAVDWTPRDAAAASPFVEAEVELLLRGSPDLLSGVAIFDVRSTAPLGDVVRVRWPADLALTQTTGPSVAAFEAAPGIGGDGTTVDVTIRLVDPRATTARFSTRFERLAAADGGQVVPSPEILGASRASAVVRIQTEPAHAVVTRRADGARRVELPDRRPLEREALAADSLPFRVEFAVVDVPETASALATTALFVEPGIARLSITLRLVAGARPVAELRGLVPDGFGVESATIESTAAPGTAAAESTPAPEGGGVSRLAIRLDPPLPPRSTATVLVRLARPERSLPDALALAPFRPDGFSAPGESTVLLTAASRRLVEVQAGARLVKGRASDAVQIETPPDTVAFYWIAPRVAGDDALAIVVREPEPRVEATIVAIASPFEERIAVTAGVRFDVTQGATDRFRIDLPAGTTEHLDVVPGGGLRLKESFKTPEGDRDVWTFAVAERRSGPVECVIRFEIGRPPATRGAPTSLPEIRARDVVRERHFVAVLSSPEIDVSAKTEGLEPIDLASLPEIASIRAERPLLHAYSAPRHPYSLALAIRARAPLPVPAIAAESALAECVVAESGLVRTRLLLTLRNAGAPHVTISLPRGSRFLTATVGGLAVKPLAKAGTGAGTLLLPIPVTRGADETVVVEVVAERAGRSLRSSGDFSIDLPSTDAVVLASELSLFLPDGFHPVAIRGTHSGGRLLGAGEGILVLDWLRSLLPASEHAGIKMGGAAAPAKGPAPPAAAPAAPATVDLLTLEETAQDDKANKDARDRKASVAFGKSVAAPIAGKKGLLPVALTLDPVGTRHALAGIGLGRVEVRLVSERAERGFVVLAAALGLLLPFALRRRGFPALATALVVVLLASVLPALLGPISTRVMNGLAAGALVAAAVIVVLAVARLGLRAGARSFPRAFRRSAAGALLLLGIGALDAAAREDASRRAVPPPLEGAVLLPYDPEAPFFRGGAAPADGDSVFVPHALYVDLWNRAHPEASLAPGDAPPRNALVSRSRITAEIGAEAVVSARFAIVVLETKWEDVVFPFGSATLLGARLDGRPAPLRPVEGGFALAIESSGLHDLVLEFSVPLDVRGDGARVLALDLPPCPSTRAELKLGDGVEMVGGETLEAGLAPSIDGGTRTVTLDLGAARRLEIAFRDGGDRGGSAAPSFEAAVATRYSVAAGRVEIDSDAEIGVLASAVGAIRISLDPTIRTRAVEGPGLAAWRASESATGTTIDLVFEPPLTGKARVRFHGVASIDASSFSLPPIRVEGAARTVDYALVSAVVDRRLRPEDVTGWLRVDPSEVRPERDSPRVVELAYRRPDGAAPGRFSALPLERRFDAVLAEDVEWGREGLAVAARFTFDRPVGVLDAVIDVPAGLETRSVVTEPVELVASRHEETVGARRHVFVRFRKALADGASLVASFSGPAPDSGDVPIARLVGAGPTSGRLVARAPSNLRLTERSSSGLRSTAAPSGARLAYSFDDAERAALSVATERSTPRLSAISFTTMNVSEDAIAAEATILYFVDVDEGDTDRFRFTITGDVDGPVAVTVDDRRLVTVTPGAGGSQDVDVETHSPKSGEVRIAARFEVRRAPGGVYRLPEVRASGTTDDAPSLGAIVCGSRGEIRPRPGPGVLEVPAEAARRRLAGVALPRDASIFEIPPGSALEAEHVAFTVEGTLEASISELSLTSHLADSDASGRGVVLTRARFTIQNRREQYLVLRLPDGALLLGAQVDDASVRPVSGAPESPDELWLPLRKTSPGDTSYTAEIVFVERHDGPLSRIGSFRPGAVEVRNMPVQRTYWTVRSDAGIDVTVDGNMVEIPEAVKTTESAERLLDEQEILLGYIDSGSESLRKRALVNFERNMVILDETLKQAEKQQQALEVEVEAGLLDQSQLEISNSNSANIRQASSRSGKLRGRAQRQAGAAQSDEAMKVESPGQATPRPDAGVDHRFKEERGEMDAETRRELERLGYTGELAGGEGATGGARIALPQRRAGLRAVAIPFPEDGASRKVVTLKKLQADAEIEIRVRRESERRPILALGAVLLGFACLVAARHWRGRRPEPNLSPTSAPAPPSPEAPAAG